MKARTELFGLSIMAFAAILMTVAAIGMGLIACGSDIDTGYVTKRVYHQPWTEVQAICMQHDKNGFCTYSIPNNIYHSATYRFDLKEGDKTGWVYVDPDTFARYEVGMHYPDAR